VPLGEKKAVIVPDLSTPVFLGWEGPVSEAGELAKLIARE
jgi:hypothetical protein